jgi:hypothetical protein
MLVTMTSLHLPLNGILVRSQATEIEQITQDVVGVSRFEGTQQIKKSQFYVYIVAQGIR